MHRKIIGIFVCMMFFTVAALPATGAFQEVNEFSPSVMEGDLIDGVEHILLTGTFPFEIVMILLAALGNKHHIISFLNIDYSNHNDVKIHLDMNIKVTKSDGSSIWEYTWYDDGTPAGWGVGIGLPFDRDDLKDNNYLTGFFKTTIDFKVREDNSSKTLSFTGFFFNYGAIVFNPWGKVIG